MRRISCFACAETGAQIFKVIFQCMAEMRTNVREFVFFSGLIKHPQTTILTYMYSMALNKKKLQHSPAIQEDTIICGVKILLAQTLVGRELSPHPTRRIWTNSSTYEWESRPRGKVTPEVCNKRESEPETPNFQPHDLNVKHSYSPSLQGGIISGQAWWTHWRDSWAHML